MGLYIANDVGAAATDEPAVPCWRAGRHHHLTQIPIRPLHSTPASSGAGSSALVPTYDAIVVGGGFMGCSIARYVRARGGSVLLLEREPDLLRRASYANQARVHNGYHYPRSLLTGLRSRVNFPRFVDEFRECVVDDFDKYYAVARRFSKVTGDQFATFCRRIDAPAEPAPPEVRALFDRRLVESVFRVREYAFDAVRLRDMLRRTMRESGVEVRLGVEARTVAPAPGGGGLILTYADGGETRQAAAREVFNCTYSGLNELLARSGLPPIPLKHEFTEMALVEVPEVLRAIGITLMCGPFFSVMPFPSAGLHSFSHVRYTPHFGWEERSAADVIPRPARELAERAETNFPRMVRDAQRYVPALAGVRYVSSLWEVKTVLPSSEVDDSRPILFRADHGLPGLTCVLGGKIDNVFDVLAEMDARDTVGAAP